MSFLQCIGWIETIKVSISSHSNSILGTAFKALFLERLESGLWRDFADARSRGSSCDKNLARCAISPVNRILYFFKDVVHSASNLTWERNKVDNGILRLFFHNHHHLWSHSTQCRSLIIFWWDGVRTSCKNILVWCRFEAEPLKVEYQVWNSSSFHYTTRPSYEDSTICGW